MSIELITSLSSKLYIQLEETSRDLNH